ncbi:ribosome-inactivating protein gelonin [Ricinus communis]|uniref:rRNA N-glycosylase n=1 Tax=Ricinus communis TaxID=3988 RepID=B9STV4_RICCO|nr:ribosome-inactivating protein gelonin [Ricinus communis]EEF32949.1 ricin-agglutinin family protein [Ricinus communis]|eukprot:XP_002529423.1 ribosome-inactivating protein gelonin [Ricinus communis]
MNSYPAESFDAGSYDAGKYTDFLNKLRGTLKSSVVSHSIPVLPTKLPVTSDKRFAMVILTSSKSTTTIALDVINAYVLGFQVGKKSYFFKDVAKDIYESKLFTGTTKARLPYGGSYQALFIAGANREKVPLGISQLNNAIFQLIKYASSPSTADIASNLLVVIQMISEAARFKYIEKKLVEKFNEDLYPKGDLLSLENNWGALSIAIQTSKNGKFSTKIALQDENYKTYYVSTVAEVQPKMGLLLAKESIRGETMFWPDNEDLIMLLSMLD